MARYKKNDNWVLLLLILFIGGFVAWNYLPSSQAETPENTTTPTEDGYTSGGGSGGYSGNDNNESGQGQGQLLCEAVYNPSTETCASAYCSEGLCYYDPGDIAHPPSCECRTCYDSDGGINFGEWGYCEDSTNSAGFPDDESTEYYCGEDGICTSTYPV